MPPQSRRAATASALLEEELDIGDTGSALAQPPVAQRQPDLPIFFTTPRLFLSFLGHEAMKTILLCFFCRLECTYVLQTASLSL